VKDLESTVEQQKGDIVRLQDELKAAKPATLSES